MCDGDDLGDATCGDAFYIGGDVVCGWDCQPDTSSCQRCTNQMQCNGAFGLSCLANGQCGTCEVDDDCPAPYPCFNGECRLN